MTVEEKRSLVRELLSSKWWEEGYDKHFSPDMTAEFPFAPPGMMQSLFPGYLIAHKEWLRRTVKSWSADIEGLWAPGEGGSTFMAVRMAGGDVLWGGQEGKFRSRHVTAVTFTGDTITGWREWSNPLDWITAAGRELPIFKVRITDEQASAPLPAAGAGKKQDCDLSAGACEARRARNIEGFLETDFKRAQAARAFSPDNYTHHVYNVPREMKEEYHGEELDFIMRWSAACTGSLRRMPGADAYETEDPNVLFVQNGNYGLKGWAGNGTYGGYTNRYINFLQLDDGGFITRWDEYMNPMAKFNSINTSIPSFPWLY